MIEGYCAVIGIFHLQLGNTPFYSSMLSRNIWPKTEDFYIVQKTWYLWEILFFCALVQLINLISSGNNYPIGRNLYFLITTWYFCYIYIKASSSSFMFLFSGIQHFHFKMEPLMLHYEEFYWLTLVFILPISAAAYFPCDDQIYSLWMIPFDGSILPVLLWIISIMHSYTSKQMQTHFQVS